MKQEAIFADDSLMSEMIPSCLKSIAYLVWHSHIFDLEEEGSADMHILNLFCCTFRCVGQLITAFLYCEYNYHCYEIIIIITLAWVATPFADTELSNYIVTCFSILCHF